MKIFLQSDITFPTIIEGIYQNTYLPSVGEAYHKTIYGYYLTYTLNQGCWEAIGKKIHVARQLYETYLTDNGYYGVGILELTRKGVPHVHCYIKKLPKGRTLDDYEKMPPKKSKGKWKTYYTDTTLECNNVLDPIKHPKQFENGMREYLLKGCVKPSVIQYLKVKNNIDYSDDL